VTDERDARGASVCERLGDLAAAASPEHGRASDAGQWAAIEARLGRPARRRRRWLVVALSAAALAGALGLAGMRRTLAYRTLACAVTDAHVRALDHGTVAFEDGTTVALAPGTGMQIEPLRFARGAELSLDDGEAKLAVVHRAGGRWAVAAGPFRVEVTGTRFAVRWSKSQGRFRVVLDEGEVRVSGGPVPPGTRLSAGQALEADAGHFSVERADHAPASPVPAAEATSPAAPPVVPTPPPAPALDHPSAAPSKPAARPSRREGVRRTSEPALVMEPESPPSVTIKPAAPPPALPPPMAAPLTPPPPWPAVPAAPVKPAHAGPWRVTIAADGSLSNGMSGHAWLSSGTGASFNLPVANLEHARLQPALGKLCTQGRMTPWSCVNEGTPTIRCNWDRNWGVAVGVFVADNEGAWGPRAPSALALDFHGRSAKYRLAVHRKGDPHDKVFCMENYRSGELAKPAQLKSRCWDDAGETLSDFTGVDHISLQFLAGTEYVAFRYCIGGITLYP
jgi:hypothetical protein